MRGPLGFLLAVVLLSWPLMFYGPGVLGAWGANAAAMVAAGAAAWLHARLAGRRLVAWSMGRGAALLAASLLPVAAYAPLLARGASPAAAVAVQLVLNLAPSWAEEVAWRSYFYGTLLAGGEGRRLLVHGLAWYLWHAPAVARAAGYLGLAAGLPLGLMQASVYSLLYRWGGVAAATMYHALHDTLRDAAMTSSAAPEALAATPILVVSAAGLASTAALLRRRVEG
ncbi:MAG: CPBP family intramembrane metalloprotease [Crenarchaeota archaeon]|nr:CPBP family intramembrane metalloprotease [Thermoproteota archaeon]